MIHINPYYLFSNVVFINIPKKFIFLEKRCWDMIHGLIFQNKLSTPTQRKKLRTLFYEAYYDYVYHRVPVDVFKFNQQIFFIYGHFNFSQSSNDLSIITDNDGDVILHSDNPYYQETNDDATIKIEDEEISDVLVKYQHANVDQSIEDRLNVLINYYINKSNEIATLVDFYGFNRLRNNLKKFLFQYSLRFFDELDIFFIKLTINDTAKLRNRIHNKEYFYLCKNCKSINQHKKNFKRPRVTYGQISQPEPTCYSHDMMWFDSSGLMKLTYGCEDYLAKKEIWIQDGFLTGYADTNSFRLGDEILDIDSTKTQDMILDTCRKKQVYVDFQKERGIKFSELSFFALNEEDDLLFKQLSNEVENFSPSKNLIEYSSSLDRLYQFYQNKNAMSNDSYSIFKSQSSTSLFNRIR